MLTMNFGSLFSGIGGFDLGFEQAGLTCAWQCEIDKNCQMLLKNKFGVEVYNDVRTINGSAGTVDLICGGFPCQDVSIAGKRAGIAGERSGLWFEFARVIDEFEPRWVVIENVPGLLSSNKGEDFATIIRWLAERGYGVCWRVLDSQYFGVAQRRRRVFIVASFGNGRAAEVLFECEGLCRDTQEIKSKGKGTASTFTIRSGKEGGGKGYLDLEDGAMTLGGQPQYLHTDPICMAHGQANAEIVRDGEPSLNCNHEQPIVAIANWQSGGGKMDDTIAATLRSGAEHSAQFVWEMQHASEVYRESQGGVAPTLQSRMGTGGNNVPLIGVRRLTPVECERLQGFPDGWTASFSDSTRYKMLGNAVTVNVAKWIGERIMECEMTDATPVPLGLRC
jgi:DNA (cytosine-5)-methyltransferase 1